MGKPVKDSVAFFKSLVEEVRLENPKNENNLGKLLLCALRRHPKDAVLQIDAGTGKQDTAGSVLERSVRMAQALREDGVGVGHVVVGMGRNHLDIVIPLFASQFLGAAFMGVDLLLKRDEVHRLLARAKPKVVFCEVFNTVVVDEVAKDLDFKVVTFGKNPDGEHPSFQDYLQRNWQETVEEFKAATFDPVETTALVAASSGTTGLPKLSDITHQNITPMMNIIWTSGLADFPTQVNMVMCLAPINWYTAYVIHIQCALFCCRKLQTSSPPSIKHIYEMVNKYKPSWIGLACPIVLALLKQPQAMQWDSFYTFAMAGCPVNDGLIDILNDLIGRPAAVNGYGLSEATGRVFYGSEKTSGSLGVPLPFTQIKLVDPYTKEEVHNDKPGELWIKTPSMCRGYYNDPEATKEAFADDGWFKTGDIVTRNDKNQYYFVDRVASMLTTVVDETIYHISPVQIENELKKMNGVADVAVTGLKTENDSVRPIAVVVKNPDVNVTEDEICRYVEAKLHKSKHLTGGVKFVESLPLTGAGKVDRRRFKAMVNEDN